jgi:hypothetical protein
MLHAACAGFGKEGRREMRQKITWWWWKIVLELAMQFYDGGLRGSRLMPHYSRASPKKTCTFSKHESCESGTNLVRI